MKITPAKSDSWGDGTRCAWRQRPFSHKSTGASGYDGGLRFDRWGMSGKEIAALGRKLECLVRLILLISLTLCAGVVDY